MAGNCYNDPSGRIGDWVGYVFADSLEMQSCRRFCTDALLFYLFLLTFQSINPVKQLFFLASLSIK
jgi:hypothetical protein